MTVSTMYDTSMDVKIFTFDLAGKCVRKRRASGSSGEIQNDSKRTRMERGHSLARISFDDTVEVKGNILNIADMNLFILWVIDSKLKTEKTTNFGSFHNL